MAVGAVRATETELYTAAVRETKRQQVTAANGEYMIAVQPVIIV